jgi:hypothetical protein
MRTQHFYILLNLLIPSILLAGCSTPQIFSESPIGKVPTVYLAESAKPKPQEITSETPETKPDKCGDGICDQVENTKGICPEDCSSGTDQKSFQSGKVYFGLMVHLEGWFNEVDDQSSFNRHMDEARELADVFELYGAKVTFEASPETIEACGKWQNVLLELENRGHGIGIHADRGYSPNPNYNQQLFTVELTEMREDAEALGLTIQHVSGTCSQLDWAQASIDAGYQFTTGGVGYCAMSMPEEIRPLQYKNCSSPGDCHGNMPLEMVDRINPWRVNSAIGDWTVDDPFGELVILASDGGIKNLYEASQDPNASHGDMEYSDEDIAILVDKVVEAIALSDPEQVNLLYLSLSIGAADVDTAFYSRMFTALQPYFDAGQLEYKSLNEIYEEYKADF